MYDIIVVGGGPAGMTAALYAQRNGKQALVIEKTGFGGQITHSPKVENIPGFASVTGNEFADTMLDQILGQGAEIEFSEVTGVRDEGDHKVVVTEDGEFEAKAVIIAAGVKHRMLGLAGEDDLVGEGISFCAVCDGDFYSGKRVAVAGGGNSALQEAVLLAEKCSEVIMLQDLDFFTGEAKLQEVLFARDNVKSYAGVKLVALHTAGSDAAGAAAFTGAANGDTAGASDMTFTGVTIEHTSGVSGAVGAQERIDCNGLFVAIGLIPENDPFAELCDLNSYGYFDTNETCVTKTPGVFVAGDCRSKTVRQVTTAAADGAIAALAACRYVNGL